MRAAAIIIGIGGIGSDICARVERMLPQGVSENRYFRFVIMDTDLNTIRSLQRSGFGGTAIKLSENMTVARCLEMLNERELAEWYPENGIFRNKAMTEGAGQYRSISRLAFEYARQKSKLDELNRIIHELNEINMEDDNQPIRFYIISSLAGGTGSGIALPVALYLNRLYMEEKKEALFNCKGFFILSSAMHELGGARLERESIDANAYAAIKELSAYMRKVDEHRYFGLYERSLRKEEDITDIGGGKIYEYCYMFGMTNRSGRTVHSFEDLKDLIANAVYMQACSPMHDMNSSLEDNTNKHLQQLARQNKETFLRRFGGIGCGELRYPYQKLKEYLAMRWAQNMMGERWQEYDVVYYQKLEDQAQKRRQGKKTESVDQGAEYISAIDKASSDSLAEEILAVCNPDEGPIWKQYLDAMYEKITQDIASGLDYEKKRGGSLVNQCDRELSALMNSHNPRKQRMRARNNLYGMLQKLLLIVEGRSRREADSYAKFWFVPHAIDDSLKPFQLEFWLMQQQEQVMHPNAVRYFLYQLRKEILSAQSREEGNVDEIKEIIYQIKDDLDVEYNPFRGNGFYERAYSRYNEVFTKIFEYVKHDIYRGVLVQAYEYVNGLAKGYEQFYGSYGELLHKFRRDCIEIEEGLDKSRGICLSYVCADKKCRERLFDEINHSPYYAQAGRGLSAYIYQLIQTQHLEAKWEKNIYEQFKGYWIDNMEDEFGDIINMDIIDAMRKQEYYQKGRTMDADHIKQCIGEVEEKLIDPFLQYIKGCGHQQGITLCCYNEEMKEKDDIHREIAKWLKERRGVPDKYYCSQYQIMFYRSMVGLNASEIAEYFHKHCYDTPLRKGKAFRSYENNIGDIYQQSDKDIVFTPHIDKDWHSFREMPDSERIYQEERELQIGIVFYYSIIDEWKDGKQEGYSFSIDEEGEIIPQNTLWAWHKYLYHNQGVVRMLAGKLMEDVIRYREGKTSHILTRLKENKIFQVILRYYSEVEIMEQDAIPHYPLLKAMVMIFGLYAEGQDDLREMQKAYLSVSKLEECINILIKDMDESGKKRIENAYPRIEKYVKHIKTAEIYQLCTRLFYIEMGAAKRKMGKSSI